MSIAKLWKTKILKTSKFLLIFLVISGWLFSSWPQIWNNPPFPPKIQKARAATGLVYVGSASSTGNSGAFSVSLTNLINEAGSSSSAAAGDLVIVIDGWNGTTDGNPGVGTAGYTEVDEQYQNDGFDVNMSTNWKTMGPAPDTSVSCNGSGSSTNGAVCLVHVWRNAASTTPMDVTVVPAGGINGATPDGLDITPVTQGVIIVSAAMATDDDNTLPTVSAPVGFINLVRAQVDPGAAISAGMVSKTWAGGADGASNWGNWDTTNTNTDAAVTIAIRPAYTFLGNDTDPGINPTIAPEAATTTVGTFNLKTDGYSDTATSTTVTLATGTATATVAVLITNSANTTTYCTSFNPSSDVVSLTGCNLPVTNASTTFNIRIKPLTHSAMPAPPGGTYLVTATITSIASTYLSGGTDTTSDTVTIDNASPNGATVTSGTAGDQKVTLNWTTSDSGDFDTTSGSVIYRWASGSAGSETPDEGTTPSVGAADGTATVACVISSAGSSAQTKIDGSGGDTGCTTAALTNGQQYTYVAFQRDTNGNYDAGASIGTFTPAAVSSLTFTIDVPSVIFVGGLTPGTPVSTSSVLTASTTNSTGYNISLVRASTTETLFLTTDPSTRITDNPNGNNWTAPAATSTAGPSAVWTDGTTKGLGFRIKLTGTAANTYSSIWWGTSDAGANAKYSGISTSTASGADSRIVNTTLGAASDEKTVVEYRVDVVGTQKSGAYTSSPVTYTALAN